MAILGFHFSGVYRGALYSGRKTATIMEGENFFRVNQRVQVYLSDEPNLFDGRIETRIGEAIIEQVAVKKVGDLTCLEASLCGEENLKGLKESLKKWYGADDNSVITYVRFDLKK